MPGLTNFDEMKIKEQGIQARNIQKLEQSGKVNFNSLEIKRSRSQRIRDIIIAVGCIIAILAGIGILNSYIN